MSLTASQQNKVSILTDVPLFQGLQATALESLALLFREQGFSDQQAVIEEGSPSPGLFVVTQGFVHVTRSGENPQEAIFLTTLGAGALIGEAALFPELRRTATIRANGNVQTLAIRREDLLQYFADEPDAARQILLCMLKDVFTKLQNTTFELRTQRVAGMKQSAIDQLFS